MHKLYSLLLALVISVSMSFNFSLFAFASTADGLGKNGDEAKAYFGIQTVLYTQGTVDSKELKAVIEQAAIDATSKSPIMVYVNKGTINIKSAVVIPENVILVSEDSVVYKRTGDDYMIKLKGAIFGGTFDGNSRGKNIIQMVSTKATAKDKNMTVMNTVIKNSPVTGVQINGDNYKYGKVIRNKITNCKLNGISVYRGGQYEVIKDNKILKIGSGSHGSGIDICSSNVGVISNNKIDTVVGHGISTDPVSDSGRIRLGCKINKISDNIIKNTKHQGVYVEKNCKVSVMNNNKISNIKGCALTVDKNAKVYSLSGNSFAKSKHSNITLNGKGSYIKIVKNNTVKNGYAAGIALSSNAKMDITGNGNAITGNKLNGIQMAKKSVLKIKGKTIITKNRWGINMAKKAKAIIKKCTIKKNRAGAVYYIKGAVFKKSKCKIKGKVYKAK